MNKIIVFLIIGVLVFSGFGVVSFPVDIFGTTTLTKSVVFSFEPKLEIKNDYLRITYEGANSQLMVPGEPELPLYITTFILPKEAQNIKVVYFLKDTGTLKLPGQITPAAIYPLSLDTPIDTQSEKDEQLYQSNILYPNTWYSYDVGRGLDGEDRVTFVKIICNVVRYNPVLSIIQYMKEADITLTYDNPRVNIVEPDIYDMVIIAPKLFVDEFQPLIDHKNSHGLNTTLKTVEDILFEYDGFDAPEKIKYFIKDAIEQWGITYVLLGGGLKSHFSANDRDDFNQGTKDWYVPVRYTNIYIDDEKGCLSDLYYADIYDENSNFSSWDSNGDGIFAALGKWGVPWDDLDLYPDVYIARLPCRNEQEIKLLINKIIVYESTYPYSKPWYKKMITIAGQTDQIYNGQPDGEYICDAAIDYMNELIREPVRVYASNRDTGGLTPISEDIIEAFFGGASFVMFQGHGSPYSWDTHWHDNSNWTGGINLNNFWQLFNGNKLPVVVVGGCHNGLFNVTIGKTLRTGFPKLRERLSILKKYNMPLTFFEQILDRILIPENHYWTYGYPAPVCFSWELCLVPWGGAIASTGCTGYGYGWVGYPISLSSELETNFFFEVGQKNAVNLGWAHGGSITKFLNENSIYKIEAHCITVYELFGDPSLKFGGYE